MGKSLETRTVSALAWRTASSVVLMASQLLVSIVMARILMPEAFGLMAMASVVTGFVALVSELGIVAAIVQRPNLSAQDLETGFALSILFGLVIASILFVSAPLVNAIYGIDQLTAVVRVLALGMFIRSLSSVSEALLLRKLQFKKLFFIDITSYLLSSAVIGVVFALIYRNAWALVAATVTESLFRTILLFVAHPPPRKVSVDKRAAMPLLHFGVGMSLARIANFMARNGDYLVVGRTIGADALGLYSRAYQLMAIPATYCTAMLNSVLFPVYSEVQSESLRVRRIYRLSVLATSLLAIPILLVLVAVAPELIVGLYGPNWRDCIVPFQLLCIGGIAKAIYPLGDALLRGVGRVYVQLRIHVLYAVLIFTGAIIGSTRGIDGVAVGVTAAMFITLLVMTKFVNDAVHIGYGETLRLLVPGSLLGIVGMGSATAIRVVLAPWNLPDLMLAAATSFAAGGAAVAVLLLGARQLLGELYTPALRQMHRVSPMLSNLFANKVH